MFKFRLQQVLDYRAMLCEDAKQKMLIARVERIQAESALAQFSSRREGVLRSPMKSLDDHMELEGRLVRIADEERFAIATINILKDEETVAETEYLARRQELQVLEKLRESSSKEWLYLEGRKEQAELDEWSVLRRVA